MMLDFPTEVVQHIFCFLSPCEIVRLRQVSKWFRDLTYDSALWREVYANAGLLLPPGPFPSQSTQCLERTLVQSELAFKAWTSRPLEVLSHTLSSWKRERTVSWTVVFGRWCIFLQGKIIECHDIDTNTNHTLYNGTAHPDFRFIACTATGVDDKRVHLLYLWLIDHNYPNEMIRLLEFSVIGDGFSEPHITDWTHIGSQLLGTRQSTNDLHGSAPFIVVRRHHPCAVLDLHTRYLYKLPVPNIPEDHSQQNEMRIHPALPSSRYHTSQIVLTKTHVIAVQKYTGRRSNDIPIFIQAFVVPDSATLRDENEIGELRLTHEVAMSLPCQHSFGLLRNSTVDPVTGSINIRLLHITTTIQISGERRRMLSLDLILPKPVSTDDVPPISIRSQHLFESAWTSERYMASDSGYVRGLLLTRSGPPLFRVASIRKFTINASGEECTATVSEPSNIYLPVGGDEVTFDGTRGRIHYYHWQVPSDVDQVITMDLA